MFSHGPECPAHLESDGAAIARVGSECIYFPLYATYLRDLSMSLGQADADAESEALADVDSRTLLAYEFGLETVAFSNLALDAALYQTAVDQGISIREDQVMSEMGLVRQWFQVLPVFFQLQELARNDDFEGFRELTEDPFLREVMVLQGEEHLALLFEEARIMDLSGAEEGMKIHLYLLESVGPDRYWEEVFANYIRRTIAINLLRNSLGPASSAQSAELPWLDLQRKTWGATTITLTDTAPENVMLPDVRSYMDRYFALERQLLESPSGSSGTP